jgi:hypothetical protein
MVLIRLLQLFKILNSYLGSSELVKTEDYSRSVFDAMKLYTIYAKDFSDAAKKVLRMMELSVLDNSVFWSRLLSREHSKVTEIYPINAAVNFSVRYLPRLIDMIEPTA